MVYLTIVAIGISLSILTLLLSEWYNDTTKEPTDEEE